ncbi:MAG: BlaI/MecI/CopY family transcriptional regulator [Lachnospiraceae bacterium]
MTRSEEEVLTTLWNAGVPLSSSQIVNAAENCSWKPSYTHLLLNSLLKKELIRVAGFQQSATNYARVFEPTITQEEYTSFLLSRQKPTSSTLTNIFATLISQETDPSTIDELELLLEERKKELEEKSKRIEFYDGYSFQRTLCMVTFYSFCWSVIISSIFVLALYFLRKKTFFILNFGVSYPASAFYIFSFGC